MASKLQNALMALRGRHTAADGGVVLFILGGMLIAIFAPASRDLGPDPHAPDQPPDPMPSSLAPVAPEGGALAAPAPHRPTEEQVVIERAWDVEGPTPHAIISWWDVDRWTAREAEQARWRSEWVAEARRRPESVPIELWPKIVEWAPSDRSLARSARALLGDDRYLRRYATRTRGAREPTDRWRRGDSNWDADRDREGSVSQLRRWARDALRQLRERGERARPSRPPG